VSSLPELPLNTLNTASFFLCNGPMPKISSTDTASATTTTALIHALYHPAPVSSFPNLGNGVQLAVFDQLAAIFQTTSHQSPAPTLRVLTTTVTMMSGMQNWLSSPKLVKFQEIDIYSALD
jgi:hypothetical protein